MAIDPAAAIVIAYVLVSIGVIITSLLAALAIGWFVDRLRGRRRRQRDKDRRPQMPRQTRVKSRGSAGRSLQCRAPSDRSIWTSKASNRSNNSALR
jgi:hypothetical protein